MLCLPKVAGVIGTRDNARARTASIRMTSFDCTERARGERPNDDDADSRRGCFPDHPGEILLTAWYASGPAGARVDRVKVGLHRLEGTGPKDLLERFGLAQAGKTDMTGQSGRLNLTKSVEDRAERVCELN